MLTVCGMLGYCIIIVRLLYDMMFFFSFISLFFCFVDVKAFVVRGPPIFISLLHVFMFS